MILEDKAGSAVNSEHDISTADEKLRATLSEYLRLSDAPDKVGPSEFVKRLETVVDYVKGNQGIKNLYKMNNKLQNEANNDLKEMEFLVKEMRATMTSISHLKRSKIDIRKELHSIRGSVEKKTKEEVQEMETVVAIYDKDLLKKWHVAKKTSSSHSLENFINNLAGKKQAIEYVYKLALDRLAALKRNKTETQVIPTYHLRFSGPDISAGLNSNETDSDSDGQLSNC